MVKGNIKDLAPAYLFQGSSDLRLEHDNQQHCTSIDDVIEYPAHGLQLQVFTDAGDNYDNAQPFNYLHGPSFFSELKQAVDDNCHQQHI